MIMSWQEIATPEIKLRWQFQLYDCDRSGEEIGWQSDLIQI